MVAQIPSQGSENEPQVDASEQRLFVVSSGAHQQASWIDADSPVPAILPTLQVSTRDSWLVDASCRALDMVGSALLLLALSPLLLVLAILVRLDSPGPALFRQQRVGRDRRLFTVNKFRTMHNGVTHDRHREFVVGLINGRTPEDEGSREDKSGRCTQGAYFKMIEDPRVTRLGRFLRRSSFDELPQLWNVLRGEMSLVGPRPAIPYEVEHYPSHWFGRFAVKPGVTGLWQVSGRSRVTLEEMVMLDVEYARQRTLWLNLKILVRTVPAVLGARGAW
jgi:lipopolysaccharide/colanic/teichoic acid biosynthesis glycosyltransferase